MENFKEVAEKCINEGTYGHFVDEEGHWYCVTPEDFGRFNGGGYVLGGIMISENGVMSIGGHIQRFVKQEDYDWERLVRSNV